MGSLVASGILTPGRPTPKMGWVKNRKFSDFTQNDFSGRFRRFPEKKIFVGKNSGQNFSKKKIPQKTHQKQIFELPLTIIHVSMGISMVAIFPRLDQKWPNGGHFSSQKCINWPIAQKLCCLAIWPCRPKLCSGRIRILRHQPFPDPIQDGRTAAILVTKIP